MNDISFKNKTYKVIEVKALTELVAKNSNCNVQVVAEGKRGAMKLFFMNTTNGNLVEVM